MSKVYQYMDGALHLLEGCTSPARGDSPQEETLTTAAEKVEFDFSWGHDRLPVLEWPQAQATVFIVPLFLEAAVETCLETEVVTGCATPEEYFFHFQAPRVALDDLSELLQDARD